MLNPEESRMATEVDCELCNLRERLKARDVAAHIQTMADLEQRAALGGLWQLCHCCQMALSLFPAHDGQ